MKPLRRILAYSHDAYGLGNIRRMLEIVNYLTRENRGISVLLLCGSPMIHAYRTMPGVDYIKLPCIGRTETGDKIVRSLDLDFEQTIRLRANLILKAALGFRPDLVLVDKKPLGIANELELALTALRFGANPPKTVLLLRDILDEPRVTISEWDLGGYHQTIQELYDKVLIVGTEQVFDAAREYRFPAGTAAKVEYCGYIARPLPSKPSEEVRREFGLGRKPLVLVCAGGGGDGYELLIAYLRGLATRTCRPFKSLLVSGPEMQLSQRRKLAALAATRGARFTEFSDDMMSCLNAADLVVSMGGYNSVCELLTLKKKVILVPRVRPVKEQWLRATRMQKLGLLRMIEPDELTPQLLLDAVEEELARVDGCARALEHFKLDGLPRINAAIAALFSERNIVSLNSVDAGGIRHVADDKVRCPDPRVSLPLPVWLGAGRRPDAPPPPPITPRRAREPKLRRGVA